MSAVYDEIFRNLPGNQRWEGSFYEQLTEYGVWNEEAFWVLHLSLTKSAGTPQSTAIDRELALALVTLQSKVLNLIAAHYDPDDIFEIQGMASERLHAFIERFQHGVLAAFSGEVIAESSYDLVNPLLVHA